MLTRAPRFKCTYSTLNFSLVDSYQPYKKTSNMKNRSAELDLAYASVCHRRACFGAVILRVKVSNIGMGCEKHEGIYWGLFRQLFN